MEELEFIEKTLKLLENTKGWNTGKKGSFFYLNPNQEWLQVYIKEKILGGEPVDNLKMRETKGYSIRMVQYETPIADVVIHAKETDGELPQEREIRLTIERIYEKHLKPEALRAKIIDLLEKEKVEMN